MSLTPIGRGVKTKSSKIIDVVKMEGGDLKSVRDVGSDNNFVSNHKELILVVEEEDEDVLFRSNKSREI
jgi:hypothetical protein